ncbi:hypothetical protein QBC37DRAFT_425277 [Rhypophila decipiens]|uniref:Uncharacterized protein n=1 Tax=Rhypophila decipiens TaxID=261697 RepID=A0AAN6YA34_9PEZI|nr:hypothetical protein QBC37DRAFT_425277 [Rhypophila decipiens]
MVKPHREIWEELLGIGPEDPPQAPVHRQPPPVQQQQPVRIEFKMGGPPPGPPPPQPERVNVNARHESDRVRFKDQSKSKSSKYRRPTAEDEYSDSDSYSGSSYSDDSESEEERRRRRRKSKTSSSSKSASKKKKSSSSSNESTWCGTIFSSLLYGGLAAIIAAYFIGDNIPSYEFNTPPPQPASSSDSEFVPEILNIHSISHKTITPDPIQEYANYMENMAPFTQQFIRDGVGSKERIKFFRDEVKSFCGQIDRVNTKRMVDGGRSWLAMKEYVDGSLEHEGKKKKGKGDAVKSALQKEKEKRKRRAKEQALLKKPTKPEVVTDWTDVRFWEGLGKDAEKWLGGAFLSDEEKLSDARSKKNVYDLTADRCQELLGIFEQLAGDRDVFADVFELSDHLLVVWPSSASTALKEGSKIIGGVLRGEKKKAALEGRKVTGKKQDFDESESELSGGSKCPPKQFDEKSAVVHLNATEGMVVISRFGEQIKTFRILAQHSVDLMTTVDRWLDKILSLSEMILEDEKVLEAYLLSDRYKGEVPKRDGWRGEIEKLQKVRDTAAPRLDNLYTTQLALGHAKNKIMESATTAAGRLGLLEKRFDELSAPTGWDKIQKIQGKKTLVKKYLAVSEEMAKDLKKRAQQIDKTMYDFKYSLWGEGRKWPDTKDSAKAETKTDESQFY